MPRVRRFGVSMEPPLVAALDGIARRAGLKNRSDAIRSLVRDRAGAPPARGEVVGVVTLVYDHGTRELLARLADLQHRHHARIVTSLHVHLSAHRCLEVLVVRGRARAVREMADRLIGTRGVEQGRLAGVAALPRTGPA